MTNPLADLEEATRQILESRGISIGLTVSKEAKMFEDAASFLEYCLANWLHIGSITNSGCRLAYGRRVDRDEIAAVLRQYSIQDS